MSHPVLRALRLHLLAGTRLILAVAAGAAVLGDLPFAEANAEGRSARDAARADTLRREMRLARMRLDPQVILTSETAYGEHLTHARDALIAADTLTSESAPAAGRLLMHLLAARDPVALAWIAEHWASREAALDPRGEVRFWVGLAAYDDGRWRAAVGCFRGRIAHPMRAHADWLAVRALERIDTAAAGAEALSRLRRSPWHPFRGLLTLRAGRYLLDRGKEAQLAPSLTRWLRSGTLPSSHRARGLTQLAEIHRRAGRWNAFTRAFMEAGAAGGAWVDEAELRADQADTILVRLEGWAPGLVRDCLLSLMRVRPAREAPRTWRDHAHRVEGEDSLAVVEVLLGALYRAGEDDMVFSLVAEIAARGSPRSRQHAHLVVGRIYRRRGDVGALVPAYRAAAGWESASLVPAGGERTAAQALWELAREWEDAGEWASAAEAFARLGDRYPRDERSGEAGLRELLCLYSAGETGESLERLAGMCASAHPRKVGGPCLWHALLADGEQRAAHLAAAAAEERPGYFALRARAALDQRAAGPASGCDSVFWAALNAEVRSPAAWQWPAAPARVARDEAIRLLQRVDDSPEGEIGVLLRAFGYRVWGREFWSAMLGWRSLGDGERAALYRALGDFQRAILMGLRIAPAGAECYPVAYAEEICAAAERFTFSPALLLAVMRQESLLEPAARSSAGAVGVMQLLPGTAGRLSRELDLWPVELERPRDNILLGSAHLAELLDEFGGALPAALAAYNGGRQNAIRWLAMARLPDGGVDWDAFIERITYAETRRFVKSVLMHYWYYLQIYPPEGAGRD